MSNGCEYQFLIDRYNWIINSIDLSNGFLINLVFINWTRQEYQYPVLDGSTRTPVCKSVPGSGVENSVQGHTYPHSPQRVVSHADVPRGSSRVPAPRTSADLSRKKRRRIAADFQIWEVHFGP